MPQRSHKQRRVRQCCVGSWPHTHAKTLDFLALSSSLGHGDYTLHKVSDAELTFVKSARETNQNDLFKKGAYRSVFNNNRAGNFAFSDIYPASLPAGIPQAHLDTRWATEGRDPLGFHKLSKVSPGQRLDEIPRSETPTVRRKWCCSIHWQ